MSFQVIAGWLILNLTVAAVIDGLNEAQANNDRFIQQDDIDDYLSKWQDFDLEQTFTIPIKKVYFFLAEIKPPFID
jgi:hypothetical protein